MVWKRKRLGLKFENTGTVNNPKIKLTVYSKTSLSDKFVERLIPEIR